MKELWSRVMVNMTESTNYEVFDEVEKEINTVTIQKRCWKFHVKNKYLLAI